MGFFRFRRSFRIAPGLRLNIGKRSTSVSVGVRGAHVTFGKAGTRTTLGVPGTGLSDAASKCDERRGATSDHNE